MENEKAPILEYKGREPMPMRTKVLLGFGAAAVGIVIGGIAYYATRAQPIPMAGVIRPAVPVWTPGTPPAGGSAIVPTTTPASPSSTTRPGAGQ